MTIEHTHQHQVDEHHDHEAPEPPQVRLLTPPWPEMCAPTPGQWLSWLDAHQDPAQREEIAGRALMAAQVANRCVAAGHDDLRVELDGALAEVARRQRSQLELAQLAEALVGVLRKTSRRGEVYRRRAERLRFPRRLP